MGFNSGFKGLTKSNIKEKVLVMTEMFCNAITVYGV